MNLRYSKSLAGAWIRRVSNPRYSSLWKASRSVANMNGSHIDEKLEVPKFQCGGVEVAKPSLLRISVRRKVEPSLNARYWWVQIPPAPPQLSKFLPRSFVGAFTPRDFEDQNFIFVQYCVKEAVVANSNAICISGSSEFSAVSGIRSKCQLR